MELVCKHNTERPSLLRWELSFVIVNLGPIQRLSVYEIYQFGDFVQSSGYYGEIISVKRSGNAI